MGRAFGLASGNGIRFLSLVPFLLVLLAVPASAQRSNLERLQGCARLIADSLLAPFHGGDTVRLQVVHHPAGWLLDGQILQHAESRDIAIAGGNPEQLLTIALLGVDVEYRPTEESDRFERIASMSVGANSAGGGLGRTSREIRSTLVDTIDAAQAQALESPGYPFSRGIVQSSGSPGFWDKIVEPVVVLGASVVMVILLFTVRSQ